jgi:LysM repeat protein
MKNYLWLILLLVLILPGCGDSSGAPDTSAPVQSIAPLVTPYYTATPAITQAPTLTPTATPTPPPLPTPTPFIHIISEGDTMIGIAGYYGVSLDALTVANPGVNPNYLSVGAELIIPLETAEDGGPDAPASSDPGVLPVTGGEVSCLPDRAGGMWCFWPVANTTDQPAENLAGVIRLYDDSGEAQWSKPGYSLLNLVRPGETITLGVYFKPPLPNWSSVQGQITSATAANRVEDRYLETEILAVNTQPVGQGGHTVEVSGTVEVNGLGEEELPAYLWLLAVAYDDDGQVVGLRRWEAPADALGESTDFEFLIYSAGRPIDRVEVLTEARTLVE